MKTCFVSMPTGQRTDAQSGSLVDFDRVYGELVAPAAEQAGLTLLSWRSGPPGGGLIQKTALGHIMSSDLLLADITTANPNVMYELGIRHAANRGPTLLLMANGNSPSFYVSYLQAIYYDPQDLTQSGTVQSRLAEAMRWAMRRSDGSPLYEFFPELRVQLPIELGEREPRHYPEGMKRALKRSGLLAPGRQRSVAVAAAEEVLRSTPDAEPAAYLDVLRGYRETSQWDRLIHAAESFPAELESDPQVQQLVALALNRRSQPGDQDRAIKLMRKLIAETGGDAETLGILGRIYKERWRNGASSGDLEQAIACYRRSFELQPNDYYTGFNAVALLFVQGDPAADAELAALLPPVKNALQQRLEAGAPDYAVLTTAVELAVIERDWPEALTLAERALALNPPPWLRATSVESLERLSRRFQGGDASGLRSVIERLEPAAGKEDDEDA